MLISGTDEVDVIPPRLRPTRRFLKGPVPWEALCAAAKLSGPALAVYLVARHRADVTGKDTVTLSKKLLAEMGVSRDAKARALHALEEAHLVSVERANGRSARIKLHVNPPTTDRQR